MKNRKIIIKFLIRFFVTYFLLLAAYSIYLKQTQQKGDVFSCDPLTEKVANQTQKLGKILGFNTFTNQHEDELSMKFFVGDVYAARIVEGCNALSVIILFIAFVIAFSGKLKHTILFIMGGSLVIHILNITRIALLMVAFYNFPEFNTFLHDILFPLAIYGTVFILWIIWVNKFSFYAKETAK